MTRLDALCAMHMCGQRNDDDARSSWQDGRAAAAALQHACVQAGSRCSLLFDEAVEALLVDEPAVGSEERRANGVRTAARRCAAG